MSAPMFATVSFVIDANGTETQETFRVPIDKSTTVRALGKSALHRYVQMQKVNTSNAICEIYVGSQQVKLFLHDIVVHVVNVAEEKVIMVVKDKLAPQQQPLPRRSESTEMIPANRAETQPAAILSRSSTQEVSKSPSPMLTSDQQIDIMSRMLARRSKSPALSRVPSEVPVNTHQHSAIKKSHHQSSAMPAAVAIASPGPIRDRRSPKKRTRGGDEVLTPEAAKVTRVETLSADDRSQFIQQKSQEGWGPEAYRNFESNYTSDPDKLGRELRKQRALQAKAMRGEKVDAIDCDAATQQQQASTTTTATANTTTTVPRRFAARSPPIALDETHVSKALFAQGDSSTSPIMIHPTDPMDLSPSARPSGWGIKASKFFDATTYHDDPSKAKLDPSLLNEPVRARRSTRGPLFD
ncbi:Hypothetical protein, putative [Bodo saltans]|uniref:Uncharacterized protein n=1 Tax=Bodo saltans TaxID=75058 RepID=A0A0S4JF36_BODSA|nr:Hypothetical protein, putative [Bodo saltans]|eukprot:CUG88736.1 Hypothetical protein, putative [Bodo saltans]